MQKRFRYSLWVVFLLLGGVGSLPAQESPKERNVISLDLMLEQGAVDNVGASEVGSGVSEVSSRLRYRQERRHGSWFLEYQPTVRRLSALSRGARIDHALQLGGTFALTKRWSINFRHRFLRSTNPFLRVDTHRPEPRTVEDVVFGPSRALVGPERRFTQVGVGATFNYQLDSHSRLDFGASYFREDRPDEFLRDHETQNFLVTYQRKYARNKSVAASYSLQFFHLPDFNQRVRTHSILFTHWYEVVPGSTLALFGGPQFSHVKADPFEELNLAFFSIPQAARTRESVIGLAVGALFTQRVTERTGLQLSVSQRVSEGAGVRGSSRQKSARVNLQRQLTRRLSASIGAYVTDNESLAVAVRKFHFSTWGLGARVNYAFNQRVSIGMRYAFSRFGGGPESVRGLLSRNRITVSLRYSFGPFPVGR